MLTYLITLPFNILSILGNLIIIGISLRFKFLCLAYPLRMIFILAIFDFLLSATLSIPNIIFNNSAMCRIQGGLLICFFSCGIIWKAFMSFEMFNIVALKKGQLRFGFFKPLILVVAISVILGLLPAMFDIISNKGDWCGVNLDYKGQYYSFFVIYIVSLYVLTWISIIWNTFVTWKIYFKLKKKLCDTNQELVHKIRLYPLILIFVFTPASVNYIFYILHQMNVVLDTLSYCLLASNGLMNALVYGFNKEVKCLIRGIFRTGSRYHELIEIG